MSIVTTYLEMRSPDQLRAAAAQMSAFKSDGRKNPTGGLIDLYFAVGERWSWIDKRSWTDEQWKEYGLAPELWTFGAYHGDSLAGYYELRRDNEDGVEIAYFGLLPEFLGRGLGGSLLTSAIEAAWRTSSSVSRVWVHTCTRDHPRALANYQSRGMAIYKVEDE